MCFDRILFGYKTLSSCKDAVQIQGLLLSRDKNRSSQSSFLRPVLCNYRHVMASNFTPPNFFFNMACFELFGGDHGNNGFRKQAEGFHPLLPLQRRKVRSRYGARKPFQEPILEFSSQVT